MVSAAPMTKPARRPRLWMSHAEGPVASAVPMIIRLTGTVEMVRSVTMVAAVSDAIEPRIAWFEPMIACAAASRPILRVGEPTGSRSSACPFI